MGNDVYANMMEVSAKAGTGKAICAFPDVCMTPPQTPATPPGVPIPYPNTGMDSDTSDGSTSVKVGGQETMLKNKSSFKKSSGDEAGAAPKKGLVTSKNMGKVYFNMWSMDVQIEGENAVRNLDLTTHNHAGAMPGNAPPWPFIAKVAPPPGGGGNEGPCKDEAKKEEEACKDAGDPCAGLGTKKPSRRKTSGEADALADKTAANDCLAAKRCQLKPYKPNQCCPPQTPHHLIEASALHDKGRGGEGSTPLQGVSDYNEDDAPCVCAEGATQHVGTHGLMHTLQSSKAAKCKPAPLALEGGGTITEKATTYGEAKKGAIEAFQKVFPESKCSKECLEAQLDKYHNDCGLKDDTPIKAVETGQTDLKAADQAIAARTVRVANMRTGASAADL